MSTYNTFCDPSVGQTLRSDGAGADYGVVTGNCAAILGGSPSSSPTNCNAGDFSVILMGDCNHINTFGSPAANGCFNFIGDGFCNVVAGEYSFLGDGCGNTINGNASFIGSGCCNIISSTLDQVNCATIAGGEQNLISDDGTNTAYYSFIGGGIANNVYGAWSAIGGGSSNCISSTSSFIGGGGDNCIEFWAISSFIGGGGGHHIYAPVSGCEANFIGGGGGHNITGAYSTIVGGSCNGTEGGCTFIGGGWNNIIGIHSDLSNISGGGANSITFSTYSFIGGGCQNVIYSVGIGACDMCFNFIGGGGQNCIVSNTSASANYAAIGGGEQNTVCANTNHASIFGGINNCVAGSCSSILGGSGNSDGGFSFIGMYGNGLVATKAPSAYGVPSAFWVDTLVAPSIPLVTPLTYANLPTGALYITTSGGYGIQQVFVK